ncbi:hypothetical protein FOA52_003028 [Chlamydomonas sp. UWO 241]|nr:hypothetical protein FOA52_003028 [Chlamydomonas sp. UWO 241]
MGKHGKRGGVKGGASGTPSVAPPPSGAPGPLTMADSDPVGFLVAPTLTAAFEREIWERKPLHVKATKERRAAFTDLFDLDVLKAIALRREEEEEDEEAEKEGGEDDDNDEEEDEDEEEEGPLVFSHDLNASRYVNGTKEYPEEKLATEANLTSLWADGYTFQVLQPQRFSDRVWRLVSALEAQVGCLVGVNVYLTPPKTQGLAAHHDDVELWICQTQGRKRWRLYKNQDGFKLPNKSSLDFTQDEVGEPIMDVTLEVGDVLYLPRGTIHQAVAHDSGSTHLTLSTYQNWSWGNLAASVVTTALNVQGPGAEGASLPMALRRSLPMGFLFAAGLQAELSSGPPGSAAAAAAPKTLASGAKMLADGLRALAAQIESPAGADLLPSAVDQFAADFLRHRVRPHPALLPDVGPPPESMDDAVVMRGRGLFMMVPIQVKREPGELEEEGGFIKLVTPLYNSRAYHMLPSHDPANQHGGEGHDHGHSDDDEDEGEEHVHGPGCNHGHDHDHGHKIEKKKHAHGENDEEGGSEGEGEDGSDFDSEGSSDSEGDDDEDETGLPGPVVPASYSVIIARMLRPTAKGEAPVVLRDLVNLAPHRDENEVLRLARTLWEDGFVCTVPAGSQPAKGKGGKRAAEGGHKVVIGGKKAKTGGKKK